MRKTKFTEEQMIDAVKQLEAGRPVKGFGAGAGDRSPDAISLASQVQRSGRE
jgi:hypothetical protein